MMNAFVQYLISAYGFVATLNRITFLV